MSEESQIISDEALMAKVCAGDMGAFDELVKRFQPRLYAFAVRRLHDDGAAEDVVQETFLKVFKYRESFRQEARFSTWVFTLALNLIRDYYRRLKPESSLERPEVAMAAEFSRHRPLQEAADKLVEKSELSELLMQAVEALPPSAKALIQSRLIQGHSFEEAAKALGLSPEAARAQASRAYKKLRQLLGDKIDRTESS